MANSFETYASPGEQETARKLVAEILARGYTLSVHDGEEWTVQKSRDASAILGALATTDSDTLRLKTPEGLMTAGDILLIWGNARDGSELIADHTSNERMNDICNPFTGWEG